MKHGFKESLIDKSHCALCKRDYMAHTKAAECESCGKLGECNIIGEHVNWKEGSYLDMLLCEACTAVQLNAFANAQREISNAVVSQSRAIDQSIRYNGDFFNARTIPIENLRAAIMADELIGTVEERKFYFQKELAAKLEHLKIHVHKLNDDLHEAQVDQQVIIKTLRDFGNEVRSEIREKIKELDSNYQPVANKPVKAPKLKSDKKDPFERLVESLAAAKNISVAQARLELMDVNKDK